MILDSSVNGPKCDTVLFVYYMQIVIDQRGLIITGLRPSNYLLLPPPPYCIASPLPNP